MGRIARLGAWTEAGIVDLNFASACVHGRRIADAVVPANMRDWLAFGSVEYTAEALRAALPQRGPNDEQLLYRHDEVRLLSPLPNPTTLRDFFAFEQHVRKGFEKRGEPLPDEWFEIPVYYKSGTHRILGPGAELTWPSFTERLDYELELACVLASGGRIAGYTIFNDFSARDIQRREMKVRLGPAKGKDFASALGPWLVTPDEVGDPYALGMRAYVNGELWSEGNSSAMHWRFEQMLAFLAEGDPMALQPGDVIGSGTVGTGCGLELDRWLKRGDVVTLEIDRLGSLSNRIAG